MERTFDGSPAESIFKCQASKTVVTLAALLFSLLELLRPGSLLNQKQQPHLLHCFLQVERVVVGKMTVELSFK